MMHTGGPDGATPSSLRYPPASSIPCGITVLKSSSRASRRHGQQPHLLEVLDVQLEAHRHLRLLRHELLLSVDEPAQLGDVRRQGPDPLHEPLAVLGEHRLVAVQHAPHVLERQLERTEPPDRVRPPGLLERGDERLRRVGAGPRRGHRLRAS